MTAIDLLLQGQSDAAVAEALGVDRKTVYRWRMRDPIFRAELELRREAIFAMHGDRMRNLLTNALDTLEKQVRDVDAPTSNRAARVLLSLSRIGQAVAPHVKHKSGD
jgi:hypothetical protein